jgi:hypothetical protein
MSLINEALKRAKQAQQEYPTPPPDLPLRPADPATQRSAGFPVLPLAALIVLVLLGGAFFIAALQKRSAAPQVVNATQADASTTPELASAEPPQQSASVAPSEPATATTLPTVQPTAPNSAPDSSSVSTPDAPAMVVPEPPKPVIPKLQGIFYNPSRPSAVVNGRTVYVGSRAGEARDFLVLEISRESVTVANGSQTNVLVLED